MKPVHPNLRQSMAWIHGWLGLLAGWILFAMFLTGTTAYFRPEITRWMQPELPSASVPASVSGPAAVRHLEQVGANDVQWFIYLPDDRTGITRVFRQAPPPKEGERPQRIPELQLAPATGTPVAARETRGGEHFYRFHFQLQLPHPWGRWLAGVCAMFMLGAIVSGVITHKRIFADFFTLRWNKGQRSWLDAHNLTAVMGLPYHAMITYTGLITLVTMYMPWPVAANYQKPADFQQAAFGTAPELEATGTRVPMVPVASLIAQAERQWQAPVGRIVVRNPGDENATVTLARHGAASINARAPTITYSGATGAVLHRSPDQGPALSTAGVMLGLHLAQFAGPALRWTYFILGLAGTAMVGTGLLLWTAARRRPNAQPFFGLKLVERLNIGVVAALPVGMIAFLLANRVIPALQPGREELEVSAFFWTWGLVALAATLRPARKAWRDVFALGAAAALAVVAVNAATVGRGLLDPTDAEPLFVAMDAAMILLAVLLGFASWRSGRPPKPIGRAARAAAQREPALA